MKEIFLFILSLAFLFISCENEGKNDADFLYSKTWKIGLTDNNPSTNPQGQIVYHAPKQCDLDDIYSFQKNGEVLINKGNEKCTADESSSETATFSIDVENKVLTIGNEHFTIVDFNKSQIKYYHSISSGYLMYLLQ